MNWDKFKPFFHESWHKKIAPFIESKECDEIYKFLKFESGRGKKIAPLSENVFRCFLETPYDEMKVVMVGLSPYHTIRNNVFIADGLLMGCTSTGYIQPSLDQFYGAIERELYSGLNVHYTQNPDVSYLAMQGILMLNAALTTAIMKAGSHTTLWEPFMKYLFEECINITSVPIVFLGKEAAKLEKYTAPFTWIFKISHPASASYNQTDWDSEGVFKSVNKILKERNNFEINWLDMPEQINDDDLPF